MCIFFDRVRLGPILLGLNLVSDLLSIHCYLDLNNNLRVSVYALSTLCLPALSDTMPPRRKPLEQRINHVTLDWASA